MNMVEISGLRKSFAEGAVAIDGISLEIAEGEVLSLLGPSGCGKTTTLRCVAGLEEADEGSINIDGRTVFSAVTGERTVVPPERRGLSMVFQQYALWPHMTVFENVAFGLSVRRVSKSDTADAVARALDRVQMARFKDRQISQLSGGQQQRVALARALAFDPKLILFDEPLSNLDAKLREEMRMVLLELQRDLGFTAIYVTHDQLEAISLSTRVAILNHGRIQQIAAPREIWGNPATSFVAEFLGDSNVLNGEFLRADGTQQLRVSEGLSLHVADNPSLNSGDRAVGYLDYSRIDILAGKTSASGPNQFTGDITLVSFLGSANLARVRVGELELTARVSADAILQQGDRVVIEIPMTATSSYPASDTA